MSCATITETKGVVPGASPVKVLEAEVHRKGLFLAAVGSDVTVAVGAAPTTPDYFVVVAGTHVMFDSLVPIGPVWASGTGTLVYGESK